MGSAAAAMAVIGRRQPAAAAAVDDVAAKRRGRRQPGLIGGLLQRHGGLQGGEGDGRLLQQVRSYKADRWINQYL